MNFVFKHPCVCVCVCVICTKLGMNVNAAGDTPTADVRHSCRFRTESMAVPSVEPEGSVTFSNQPGTKPHSDSRESTPYPYILI